MALLDSYTNKICRHCLLTTDPHTFVCDCGHHHNDHEFAGGCLLCDKCDRYSQRKHRRSGDPDEKFAPEIKLEIKNV